MADILSRLKGWRDVLAFGGPRYLSDNAPKIVRELELELEEKIAAGGHGVNLASMSIEEIRKRLLDPQ